MHESYLPSNSRSIAFKTRPLKVIRQLFKWSLGLLYFLSMLIWDKIFSDKGLKKQGKRLRQTFEWMGGAMIKIGQQLSLRIDMLPYEYCEELGKLLDQQPFFPLQQAIQKIEKVNGKKIEEIFSSFNPDPIGSASIACVYKAHLKNGMPVAVKVRRPGIGETFMADFHVLDFICYLLELFTVIRSGYTRYLRRDLKDSLMEEMDFRKEARYQELFRKSLRRLKIKSISSPKIYHSLSSADVLVMEHVDGILLSKVMKGIEENDHQYLSVLRQMNIEPRKLARRILRVSHMGMLSEPFFHADPHPANIFIQKDSKLVFIDFGACGFFSHSQKACLKQINFHQQEGNTEEMARMTLKMIQPLPPIEIYEFSNELEKIYRVSVLAMADKNSEWWERTTAVHWISFMKLALQYRVPLPIGLVQMIRATMLYDTIGVRLDKSIDFYQEYRKSEILFGMATKDHSIDRFLQAMAQEMGTKHNFYFEQMQSVIKRYFQPQGIADKSSVASMITITQKHYFLKLIVDFIIFMSCVTGMIILIHLLFRSSSIKAFDAIRYIRSLAIQQWYQVVWLVSICLLIRKTYFHLDKKKFIQSR